MKFKKEEQFRKNAVLRVAEDMCIAARTAPKGRAKDNLFIVIVKGEDLKYLSEKMEVVGKKEGFDFFIRDASNVLSSNALVMLGTKIGPVGLKKCGFCGFDSCEEKSKHVNIPCAFNTGDLGIAIGSAVSVAMHNKVDNRIMFSAGYAAIKSGLIDKDVKIAYGIPLSVSGKNPFFDRK